MANTITSTRFRRIGIEETEKPFLAELPRYDT
jgi:hypothetical protein